MDGDEEIDLLDIEYDESEEALGAELIEDVYRNAPLDVANGHSDLADRLLMLEVEPYYALSRKERWLIWTVNIAIVCLIIIAFYIWLR